MDSNHPLYPCPLFPPKCPAVAPVDSCFRSRTNLSCREKLCVGVGGFWGFVFPQTSDTPLYAAVSWVEYGKMLTGSRFRYRNQRLQLSVCLQPNCSEHVKSGALSSSYKYPQDVYSMYQIFSLLSVWILENTREMAYA